MLRHEKKQRFNNFLKDSRNKFRRPKTVLRCVIFVALSSILFNLHGSDTWKQVNLHYSKPLRKLRTLVSILPDGNCEWVEPTNFVGDENLFSTVLVAYPGSAKRAAFVHLEGLTWVSNSKASVDFPPVCAGVFRTYRLSFSPLLFHVHCYLSPKWAAGDWWP